MTYEDHNKDQCDKCNEEVGEETLRPVSFLYLDMNDKAHKDLGNGYRRYRVCVECRKLKGCQ